MIMHNLQIHMERPGRGTVTLDGKPITVQSVEFRAGVDIPNIVVLEVLVNGAAIEAKNTRLALRPPPPRIPGRLMMIEAAGVAVIIALTLVAALVLWALAK